MDSVLKLVYDDWVTINGKRHPLFNGIHPIIKNELINEINKKVGEFSVDAIIEDIRSATQGNAFLYGHSNFLGYFKKYFSTDQLVSLDEINDDAIYILPLEIRTVTSDTYKNHTIIFKGQTINYSVADTFSPKLLQLLQQGKVKILFNLAHDPLDEVSQLWDIEQYFGKYGIDGSNLIFVPGNDCGPEYRSQYPKSKLRVSPARWLITQQAVLNDFSFPRPTSLGYVSDIVREQDLNPAIQRPKRFLCLNRTMREHRYILAYLALKHNLLENSIFSFVNGFDHGIEHVSNLLEEYDSSDDMMMYAKRILKLIPYELDTHHLQGGQKGGFNSENTKKEWFSSTYVHITSESRFLRGKTPFISEKTWRPMTNLQPFIFVGNFHSLRELHEMGFKTFHPFIDESYDEETDYKLRMKKIAKEIEKLNNMPIEQLHDWYYSITDILLHNQQQMKPLAYINPYENTFKDIDNFYKKEKNGI